jgi:hypothetical protein
MSVISEPVEVYRHPHKDEARCWFSAMRAEVPQDAGEEPILRFLGSNESEDRYGSIIDPRGGDYTAYRLNPVFLWAHNYVEPPIGKTISLDASQQGPVFTVRFAVEAYDKAALIYRLYKGGYLRGVSVGVIPKKWEQIEAKTIPEAWAENRRYTLWELLELSGTPVPANRTALMMALQDRAVAENEVRKFGLEGMLYRDLPYIMVGIAASRTSVKLPVAPEAPAPVEVPETPAAPAVEESAPNPHESEAPTASCLICGVQKTLAAWHSVSRCGVCAECRDARTELTALRAGRVLSKSNMEALVGAVEAIQNGGEKIRAVLAAAGYATSVADDDAADEVPETVTDDAELIRSLEATRSEIFGSPVATATGTESPSDAPTTSPDLQRLVDFIFAR